MEFIKYNGTYGGNIEGKLNADLGHGVGNTDVTLAGKDSSKLHSDLGSLRKEEVDMQKLLRDCKDRLVTSACTSRFLLQPARIPHTLRLNFV